MKKWILLLYQIPTKLDSDRVRIWRGLQKLGVVTVKNSVVALPDNKYFRLKIIETASEITQIGGEAIVIESHPLYGLSAEVLNQAYNSQLDVEYKILAQEIHELIKKIPQKIAINDLMKFEHKRTKFKSLYLDLEKRQIGSSFDGKDLCKLNLETFEKKLKGVKTPKITIKARKPNGSVWVTRVNLHVDRLASAWLIKKYIDPKAKFLFVDLAQYEHKPEHLRFDLFQGEYSHIDDKCTFEVLVESFKIRHPSIKILAEIIHDLDINDNKFERKETEGIRMALDGIIKGYKDDLSRLQAAQHLFDSLSLSLK